MAVHMDFNLNEKGRELLKEKLREQIEKYQRVIADDTPEAREELLRLAGFLSFDIDAFSRNFKYGGLGRAFLKELIEFPVDGNFNVDFVVNTEDDDASEAELALDRLYNILKYTNFTDMEKAKFISFFDQNRDELMYLVNPQSVTLDDLEPQT